MWTCFLLAGMLVPDGVGFFFIGTQFGVARTTRSGDDRVRSTASCFINMESGDVEK
jgi:hypothetical protein